MKNAISLLLPGLILALTACGAGEPAPPPDPNAADDRGIPGLMAQPLADILTGAPYHFPAWVRTISQDEDAAFCYRGKTKDDTGLTLDYEITSDANDELVYASLSVSAKRMSDTGLYQTALRLSEHVSDLPYDTAEGDRLLTWLKDRLGTYSALVESSTVGDAVFTLSSMPELNYTIEISRVPEE